MPIRQEMRPKKAKYINSFDGSIVLMKFSTTVSAGMGTYLAATEDTMIKAKTDDQIIILVKCFIISFPMSVLVCLIEDSSQPAKHCRRQNPRGMRSLFRFMSTKQP
jgi:hypothetical protein